MEYPKLPHSLDRRRVLTERELLEMKELRNNGMTSRAIAKIYAISKTIVLYHTNDDEYRDRVNKKRYALIAAREKRDVNYKKQRTKEKKESFKSVLKRSEPVRKWKAKLTYKWKKAKLKSDPEFRKKTNEQALNLYHKKKEKSPKQ